MDLREFVVELVSYSFWVHWSGVKNIIIIRWIVKVSYDLPFIGQVKSHAFIWRHITVQSGVMVHGSGWAACTLRLPVIEMHLWRISYQPNELTRNYCTVLYPSYLRQRLTYAKITGRMCINSFQNDSSVIAGSQEYYLKRKKEFFRPIAKDNPRKPLKEAYFHWGPRSFF